MRVIGRFPRIVPGGRRRNTGQSRKKSNPRRTAPKVGMCYPPPWGAPGRRTNRRFAPRSKGKDAISRGGLYCAANFQAFHADPNVSKQDTHFFNTFSMVIGLLIVIAIGIFALARVVAAETQDKQVLEESQYVKSVEGHLQPVGKEAIAGADNSALAIKADAGASGA